MKDNLLETAELFRIQLRKLTILVQEVAAAKPARTGNLKSITHNARLCENSFFDHPIHRLVSSKFVMSKI
jgi:hypothetical protein